MNKTLNLFLLIVVIGFVSCSSPEPRHPISRKSHRSADESIALRASINQSEIDAIQQFIKKDTVHQYLNSNKGFWIAYQLKNNKNYQPKFGDRVLYTYQVEDLDSKIIYSFDEIGERSYNVEQQDLEEGLREAIKILNEEEQAIFLFPSFKMYSFAGDSKKIKPLQTLKITVKTIKININNEFN